MPVPVVVAIAVVSLLALMGVAVIAKTVLAIARDGVWAEGEFAKGLPIPARAVDVVWNALFPVIAALSVRGLLRRSDRARAMTFSVALAASILFGAVGSAFVIIAAVYLRPADVALAAALLLFTLLPAATAWALSRPATKAWFGPPPPR
jgi:hypothetical protein